MSGVAFLLVAVGLSLIGSIIIWLRTRKPTTWDGFFAAFSRNLVALAEAKPGESVRCRCRSASLC